MKFDSGRSSEGELGQLKTQRLKINQSCLSFYVYSRKDFDGGLRILLQNYASLHYTEKLHDVRMSQTASWVQYKVPIPSGEYQLIFEGEVKSPLKSDFALDDVALADLDECTIEMPSHSNGSPSKYFLFFTSEGKRAG